MTESTMDREMAGLDSTVAIQTQDGSQGSTLFSAMRDMGHEQVSFHSDPDSGLKAIIAIHSTVLGPSLGGVRMWPYASEAEALRDVLRLSRGMSYKSSIAGMNLGGGKAVIIGDSRTGKSEALFRAFGRFVDGLAGRYITAEDVGMEEQNMVWIRKETRHVTGVPMAMGGSGDPSPKTAYGVYMGMKACAQSAYGSDSLTGKRVAIQGAGHVASYLAESLAKEGALLTVSDLYPDKAVALAERTGAQVVDADRILGTDVDILSPCALGGVLNAETIPMLRCDIIAGGANNLLDREDRDGEALRARGILYAPDFAINSGGVMNVGAELDGYDERAVMQRVSGIYDIILKVLDMSERLGIPTYEAANRMAKERIQSVLQAGQRWTGTSTAPLN